MLLNHKIEINDAFRDLLKRRQYEEYVFLAVQRSNRFFRDKNLKMVEEQSNGECDFIDKDGKKYDIKLLINKEQGALIGERKNKNSKWIENLLYESCEFSEILQKSRYDKVSESKLYKIAKERLLSVKDDENAVFFIPFQIVLDNEYAPFLQFATDYIDLIVEQFDKDNLIKGREIYFIYPTMNKGRFVIRDYKKYREYISLPELDCVSFETSVIVWVFIVNIILLFSSVELFL